MRLAGHEWNAHQQPGNLVVHVVAHGVVTTALALLLARVELPLFSLGALYLACVVLRHALVDVPTALLAALFYALATGAWRGAMFAVSPYWLVAAVAGGLALARIGHHVYYDRTGGHFERSRAELVRDAAAVLFACPLYLLFVLLRTGYRPALARRIEAARDRLHAPRHDRPWRNWAGTARCRPHTLWHPHSADEIAEIVKLARREAKRVRVVGSAFSWSQLVPSTDFVVCLCQMRDVKLDLSDAAAPRAIVEAGATGRDLNRVIGPAGYCVTSNVVMQTVSWGGMIAVGAHGSGRGEGTVSDFVEAVELVDGRGRLRRFEAGSDPDEILAAVRVALGLCGVIHRITLRIVPEFRVVMEDEFVPAEQAIARLPEQVRANEYFDLYWVPFNTVAWTRAWNRTDAPLTPRGPQGLWDGYSAHTHWGHWVSALQSATMALFDGLMRRIPALTPAICRAKCALMRPLSRVIHINEATHFRHALEMYRLGCLELAFAVDPDFASVRDAWRSVTRAVDRWAARGRYPLNMVLNMRFVGGSSAYLAPAHGNRITCYVEVLGNHENPDWAPFIRELADEWLELPNARMHWGKQFPDLPDGMARLRRNFGTDLDRFVKVREDYELDPDGLFSNTFLEPLLAVRPEQPSEADNNVPCDANTKSAA
jgi:L-gulono-1,4-lactone dehydrogenase